MRMRPGRLTVRVLVGGVGYRNLRDHSAGLVVSDMLAARSAGEWSDDWRRQPTVHVVVEDLSYNPLAVGWRLEDEPAQHRFDRLILVAAVARGVRAPGTVTAYQWDGVLPCDDEIQRAVAEAVTGIISVDNTLVILRHFGALPNEALVVEIEPLVHSYGETLSAVVQHQLEALCALVTRLAVDGPLSAGLSVASLGAGAAAIAVGPS